VDQPAQVAAAEIAAETEIAVNVRERIGCRVHPITRAQCEYFLCEDLHGQPANLDPQENAEVAWAPIAGLDRYIDLQLVYAPAGRCGRCPTGGSGPRTGRSCW
jgi:8-oxo-dGTP diphosphatase